MPPSTPPLRNHDNGKSPRRKKIDAAVIAALIAGITAIIVALINTMGASGQDRDPEPTPTGTPSTSATTAEPEPTSTNRRTIGPTPGPEESTDDPTQEAVELSLKGGSRSIPVTVTVNQRPPAGKAYYMVQILNGVDPGNPHPEYYPKGQVGPQVGTQEITLDYANADAELDRAMIVYEVDTEDLPWLREAVSTGGDSLTTQQLVSAPCKKCTVAGPIDFEIE